VKGHRAEVALGVLLAIGLLATGSSAALAECINQQNKFPAFTSVAPTASRVVIGTVEPKHSSGRWTSSFFLHVTDRLRGSAPDVVSVESVHSGLPSAGPGTCYSDAVISASAGDVIAIAYNGRLGAYPGREITTVAWIDGKSLAMSMHGVQHLTRHQVLAAVAPPDTSALVDTAAAPGEGALAPSFVLLATFGLTGAAAVGLWSRRRKVGPLA
jgi:hypothetical protein